MSDDLKAKLDFLAWDNLQLKAEVERLRDEMSTMHRTVVHQCCEDKQKAEAAIARVNAVLAQHWDWKAGRALAFAIRAALDNKEA